MKLKQKSLIINVFAKAAFAALLMSGLQPVLVHAEAPFTTTEPVVQTQIQEFSAPVQTVGKSVLPDLQQSFNQSKQNNFVQLTYGFSFSQNVQVQTNNIVVVNSSAQKEVQVQNISSAGIRIVQKKISFSIYKLSPEAQSAQPVIAVSRVEMPEVAQSAKLSLLGLVVMALLLLSEQIKTKNSLRFEVLRC